MEFINKNVESKPTHIIIMIKKGVCREDCDKIINYDGEDKMIRGISYSEHHTYYENDYTNRNIESHIQFIIEGCLSKEQAFDYLMDLCDKHGLSNYKIGYLTKPCVYEYMN